MDKIFFFKYMPFFLNPIAFEIGPFSVTWYSLMYLVGFWVVYSLIKYRIRKGEGDIIKTSQLFDFLIFVFLGLIAGARLGEVFLYDPEYYFSNPVRIISPFDPVTKEFIGIYGMSYHGGLVGALLAGWIFAKKRNINFWSLVNFITPAVPAGYFFGRLGNFINSELWGRETKMPWGMYFPGDDLGLLRHPSQLYEAFFEGLVLFFLLWPLRNKENIKDKILLLYLLGYALFRFFIEFFREPEEPTGMLLGYFTLGQILSFFMAAFAIFIILKKRKKKSII
ncbi:MAG TPA: prolipoprotein diacylglyceryl transferase [Candidatus Moranbacteria bacterium]|nr:prolipoprotein diacylglyceryl transferase [Candidatus Moranbacteria bacterium]